LADVFNGINQLGYLVIVAIYTAFIDFYLVLARNQPGSPQGKLKAAECSRC
jgi:hypothetical protein